MKDIEINVLNAGFVKLVDVMGTDDDIANAARVSYSAGDDSKKVNNNKNLVRYLLKHEHTSPFEMVQIKFHIKAPIFIARQWMRHRTASINEISARYSVLNKEYYVPELNQIAKQSTDNKQGRGECFSKETGKELQELLEKSQKQSYEIYENLLECGLSRELARVVLPVGMYTEWYWRMDLNNLLKFLRLRLHPHAQYEIRVYAEAIMQIIKELFPVTYGAFTDYILDSKKISSNVWNGLSKQIDKKNLNKPENVTVREWDELINLL